MPLPPFIQATVKKDLSFLIIPGQDEHAEQPAPEQLEAAWLAINSEYVEIVGDVNTVSYAADLNRINELEARLLRLRLVIASLKEFPYQPALVDILKEEDFGLKLDADDWQQFQADLDRALVELIQDEIELEKLQEKEESDEQEEKRAPVPVTEAHFDKILIEISSKDNEGVSYKAADLTVRQYAILLNRLRTRRRPQTAQ